MRNDKWISPSRFHGERYARTMQEAFGPYATLYPTQRRRRPALVLSVLFAVAVFVALAFAWLA